MRGYWAAEMAARGGCFEMPLMGCDKWTRVLGFALPTYALNCMRQSEKKKEKGKRKKYTQIQGSGPTA
jgi:hypothetical protein